VLPLPGNTTTYVYQSLLMLSQGTIGVKYTNHGSKIKDISWSG
jgi:hypothetical protein